jgi:hypothetical protein
MRHFSRPAVPLTGIALALSLGFSATAQAAPTAYWSAGSTCGTPASSVDFTPGSAVTATLCATNFAPSEYVCGWDAKFQVPSTAQNGLFAVTGRVMNPSLTDTATPNPTPATPVAIVNPADLPNWGAGVTIISQAVDPAGADVLLATFTFSVDAAAGTGPYTIELALPPSGPKIGISPTVTGCGLTESLYDITASLSLEQAGSPPDTTPPVMNTLNCGTPALTNAITRSISFSATDNVGVTGYECRLNGGAYAACSSPRNLTGLTEGPQTFVVRAFDAAGNRSTDASGTCTWTIDTTPPPAPTFTSTPTNPDTSQTARFAFTDAEAGVIYKCSLNGGALYACSSPTSVNLTTPGPQNLKVYAIDAAGNQSANPASYNWVANFVPAASTTAVPTLSEWSLILLGLLLSGFAMLGAARNRGMR